VAQDHLIVDDGQHFGITPGDTDAFSILVSAPPSQPWNVTTAKQVCTGFIPLDGSPLSEWVAVKIDTGGEVKGNREQGRRRG